VLAAALQKLRRESGARAERMIIEGSRVVFVDFSQVPSFVVTTDPPGGSLPTINAFASTLGL